MQYRTLTVQNLKTNHRKVGSQKRTKRGRKRVIMTLGHQVKSGHSHSVDLILKITGEVFQNLMKDMDIQIQRTQKSPMKI